MVRTGNQKKTTPEIKQLFRRNPNQILMALSIDKGLGCGSWAHGISQEHKGLQLAHSRGGMGICRWGPILPNQYTQLGVSLFTGRIWKKGDQVSTNVWRKLAQMPWDDQEHGHTGIQIMDPPLMWPLESDFTFPSLHLFIHNIGDNSSYHIVWLQRLAFHVQEHSRDQLLILDSKLSLCTSNFSCFYLYLLTFTSYLRATLLQFYVQQNYL